MTILFKLYLFWNCVLFFNCIFLCMYYIFTDLFHLLVFAPSDHSILLCPWHCWGNPCLAGRGSRCLQGPWGSQLPSEGSAGVLGSLCGAAGMDFISSSPIICRSLAQEGSGGCGRAHPRELPVVPVSSCQALGAMWTSQGSSCCSSAPSPSCNSSPGMGQPGCWWHWEGSVTNTPALQPISGAIVPSVTPGLALPAVTPSPNSRCINSRAVPLDGDLISAGSAE